MKKYLKIGCMSLVAFFLINISSNAKSTDDVGTTSSSIVCNTSKASNKIFPNAEFQTMQGKSFRQRVSAYLRGAIYGTPQIKSIDLDEKLTNFDN